MREKRDGPEQCSGSEMRNVSKRVDVHGVLLQSIENVKMLVFSADVRRSAGPDHRKEAQLSRVKEHFAELLCQLMLRARIAESAEKAVSLLDINCIPNTRSYKVQITLGFSNCFWKVDHAILDAGGRPYVILMDAVGASRSTSINRMKPKELRSSAGTSLRVGRSVLWGMQIG